MLLELINLHNFYNTEFGKYISHDKRISNTLGNIDMRAIMGRVQVLRETEGDNEYAEYICSLYAQVFDELSSIIPKESFATRRLFALLCLKSLKLKKSVLLRDDQNTKILADQLTKLILKPKVLKVMVCLIEVIETVSKYYMTELLLCRDSKESEHIISNLKLNLEAVAILDDLYFKTKLSMIKKEIETVLNFHSSTTRNVVDTSFSEVLELVSYPAGENPTDDESRQLNHRDDAFLEFLS
ncbi:hypothetical protein AKO1_015661 [Acrasis kona]|uniref:Uncharacterized protein n=1 Tax=Acrasis kona TaxID=1008807 RepID=A0AAW2ZIS0_9EUKA